MKVRRKNKDKDPQKRRIVAYVDDDMLAWLDKKADSIRVSHSFLVREMILQAMSATIKQ